MNPIYNEYIQFLNHHNINLDLKEGYYWLDNSIIKAYDVNGNIHKIYRIKIDNNLNLTYTTYTNKDFTIESWQDTINRNKDKLDKLELESIELINKKLLEYKNYVPVIFTSTGKDSELTKYLVNKSSQLKTKPIIMFNNTSMDCADTYKMAKSIPNCLIINPKEGFYNKIKAWGVPTRHDRWCCSIYKEGETKKYLDNNQRYIFFYGMRNDESSTRADYQDERYDIRWENREWIGILPIRKWTEEMVWLYTIRENININPKYRKGYARVGCAIACPYYTKSTWILDKYWYSKMYNRFQQFLKEDFLKRQLWCTLNCTIKEYPLCWNGGKIRPEPTEEVINECAEYKGINKEVAIKYFNKLCFDCGKKITKNDVIAMNLKLIGRNTEQFLCKKCLKKHLNINTKQWSNYILEFKQNGCNLF